MIPSESGLIGRIRGAVRWLADLLGAYRYVPGIMELPDGSRWLKLRDAYSSPKPVIHLPGANPFMATEETKQMRSVISMELLDEETYGFVLFTLKREPDGTGSMDLRVQSAERWMPLFTAAFAEVMESIEAFHT